MKTGVYAIKGFELVITNEFVIIYFSEKDFYGVKVFKNNKLVAYVKREYGDKQKAKYLFFVDDSNFCTNMLDIKFIINEKPDLYKYENDLQLIIKDVIITKDSNITPPPVSEIGIAKSLKLWILGIEYRVMENSFYFHMQTNKLEYIIAIDHNEEENIYCGIAQNIPFENGLFSGGQYFRIRNYADNTESWCWRICDLGNSIQEKNFDQYICENGKCIQTNEGIYWLVKRFTDDQIVLQGCGNDEYIYNRNISLYERFDIE